MTAAEKMAQYLNSQYPGMGTAYLQSRAGAAPEPTPDPVNTRYPWLNQTGSYNLVSPEEGFYSLAGAPPVTATGGWDVGPQSPWQAGYGYGDYRTGIAPGGQAQIDPYTGTYRGGNADDQTRIVDPNDPNHPRNLLAPGGGDLRGWWDQFIQGQTPGPNFLQENRAAIEGAGWQLERPNAAGVVSKIINPRTGEIIRVLNNADNPSAGVSFNWVPQPTGGGAGGDPGGFGGLTEPFREAFNYAEFTPPEDFTAPTWEAPQTVGDFNDPGYTARLREGEQALERAASAKGTLLTGGTAKGLQQYGQDYAANEYQNVYNRRYGEYQSDYAKKWGEYLTNYQQQAGEWERGYGKALGEYQQRYGIFQNNQGNAYNRMLGVAQLGLQGTNAQAQLGAGYAQNYGNILGNYGNNLSNLITGAGNATAAGQAGAGSAWGNAFGNIGNQVGNSLYGYQLLNNLGAGGTAGWHGVR